MRLSVPVARETAACQSSQVKGLGVGSSQNQGPILVPLNIRSRNTTIYNPTGPIIFRTTQVNISGGSSKLLRFGSFSKYP